MAKTRERFGDWEVDTVLGKLGISALVTLVDQMRYMYRIKRVDTKRAADVRIAVIEMPKPYATRVHTITANNGSEFVEHEKQLRNWVLNSSAPRPIVGTRPE